MLKLQFSPVTYLFGAPGSGKSTVLCAIAQGFIKKGVRVYSNSDIIGTIRIQDEDLGRYSFRSSVILIDEAGLGYNNREFKNGLMNDKQRLEYWRLVRHFGSIIVIASQGWDEVDKKCRTLAQSYYLITRSIIPGFTSIRKVIKKCDIDQNTHQPTDFFIFDVPWHNRHVWRRKYYKYFNSFSCPELPEYPDQDHIVLGLGYDEPDPVPEEIEIDNDDLIDD